MEVLMDVRDAAAFFRVSPRLIRKWIREEGLPVDRTSVNGRYRIRLSRAEEWWDEKQRRMLSDRLSVPNDILDFAKEIFSQAERRVA